ncbi:MAG: MFS transporter [Proteobacteria bacterium]|nr:MFS transporter [Pseudomonadota bacterium]
MGLKFYLIMMTAVAVLSDSMLLPFYPQYFAGRFGQTSPEHVGSYIAAICLTAMLALPFWARIVRTTNTLRLLCWTQLAAGLLCIACSFVGSLWLFWLLSLAMIVFKASYLLVYPHIMQREEESKHAHTIGVLSIVVHFGHIAGAVIGGAMLSYWPMEQAFLLMAAGDFIQMAMCRYVLKKGLDRDPIPAAPVSHSPATGGGRQIYLLGILMLLFYFSEYQIVPFFVQYWQAIAPEHGMQLAAWVYAIPAAVGLAALWLNHKRSGFMDGIYFCLLLGLAGLVLQASGQTGWVLLGRVLFGWASFQLTVRLDMLLFEISTPDSYASDYSKINLFQNIGVLLSSYSAGILVAKHGLSMPFWLAAGGFALLIMLWPLLMPARYTLNRNTADALP